MHYFKEFVYNASSLVNYNHDVDFYVYFMIILRLEARLFNIILIE